MSKAPSADTQLKTLRREYKTLKLNAETLKVELTHYRARATKAETEAAEWRKRFDMLLSKGFSDTSEVNS